MVGGMRKGAWNEEEDSLLRKCVEKYGEGNWHKVPFRAGLNRCRKSCRLRWLNYLRPNIKKGNFSLDEVDLIIRLHKLLGNRWSLIAGRLPGRTANDVKNYWNTHQSKKCKSKPEPNFTTSKAKEAPTSETNIFKPRPRTFVRPNIIASFFSTTLTQNDDDMFPNIIPLNGIITDPPFSSSPILETSDSGLFEGLFQNDREEAGGSWPSHFSGLEDEAVNMFWSEDVQTFLDQCNKEGDCDSKNEDKEKTLIWDKDNVNESSIDMDIWELLGYT